MSGAAPGQRPLRLNCDRLWTHLVTLSYRLRRKPRVTNSPPPIQRRG
ncbi:MAG: hypothetical protein R2713_17235 [Ilumatobacteraceae bacterium]|nr:hypothetical protein [Acidimicrobiales bacterium]MCB9392296.1 hypothetical protein [Acidimicrobiaceae bacterium]